MLFGGFPFPVVRYIGFCACKVLYTPSRFRPPIDVGPSMSVVLPYSDWCVPHRRVLSAVPTPSAADSTC